MSDRTSGLSRFRIPAANRRAKQEGRLARTSVRAGRPFLLSGSRLNFFRFSHGVNMRNNDYPPKGWLQHLVSTASIS